MSAQCDRYTLSENTMVGYLVRNSARKLLSPTSSLNKAHQVTVFGIRQTKINDLQKKNTVGSSVIKNS